MLPTLQRCIRVTAMSAVLLGGLAAVPESAGAKTFGVRFELVDAMTSVREVATLVLRTEDDTSFGFGGFEGYKVLSVGGTQDGLPVSGPDLFDFNGTLTDNLFNPDPTTNFVSLGGIGYVEMPDGPYQLYYNTRLLGCEPSCGEQPDPQIPTFFIENFTVPAPGALGLMVFGLAAMGAVRRKRP
jgi:hypothetical protein